MQPEPDEEKMAQKQRHPRKSADVPCPRLQGSGADLTTLLLVDSLASHAGATLTLVVRYYSSRVPVGGAMGASVKGMRRQPVGSYSLDRVT